MRRSIIMDNAASEVVELLDATVAEPSISEHGDEVALLLDRLEGIYDGGWFPRLEITRPWSAHNATISGEFARPDVIRGYLVRELSLLARQGASFAITPSRQIVGVHDPRFFGALNEVHLNPHAKKIFAVPPERMLLSFARLEHYCGTPVESFQRYIVLTNYDMHVQVFRDRFPDAQGPWRGGVQMPAWHLPLPGGNGVSLVNIGVGPSNAKTIIDHLAALRPDAVVLMGHCGGLRNGQEMGSFVLASSFLRDDRVLDDVLPSTVPVVPNLILNQVLADELAAQNATYRFGLVCTTDDRNWEFSQGERLERMRAARCIAVDMESATVIGSCARYRIPSASLLCVSDKPLHAAPKLSAGAEAFYESSKRKHLDLVLSALGHLRERYSERLPHDALPAARS